MLERVYKESILFICIDIYISIFVMCIYIYTSLSVIFFTNGRCELVFFMELDELAKFITGYARTSNSCHAGGHVLTFGLASRRLTFITR